MDDQYQLGDKMFVCQKVCGLTCRFVCESVTWLVINLYYSME